ncbi:glycosyltransferase family 2 protein [Paenibacillus gansuensis]|uniref:Glycosyltransferase family 2 protein n=1 Tax=Paenibacillus gansuensis TaxID=306542 RepID=A0ABW5PBL2_9BACL
MNLTSIIIPNYNGRTLLADCIYSIRQHTDVPYEIIVVDNGSTDGSTEFCRQEQITFVSLPENRGFPAACNIGLQLSRGDNLLLLNNDVLVTREWLERMLDCLHSSADIGVVGPVTDYASGRQQLDVSGMQQEEVLAQFSTRDRGKWQVADRIVGLCYLMKREVFDRVGLLDERFSPGHYEDDDYCFRVRLEGYRLMIAGDSFIYHLGSKSFGKEDQEQVKELLIRNREKFIAKWGVDPSIYM